MGGGTGALTRLLYEMDGIDSKTLKEKLKGKLFQIMGKKPPDRNWHVLFMGSTNRPDVIDPALKRPGRFDQLIKVDLPDRTGRREIVEGYLRTVNHDDTVDIEAIVMNNRAATPAQIMAAITKDAVRVALFDHRNAVSQAGYREGVPAAVHRHREPRPRRWRNSSVGRSRCTKPATPSPSTT